MDLYRFEHAFERVRLVGLKPKLLPLNQIDWLRLTIKKSNLYQKNYNKNPVCIGFSIVYGSELFVNFFSQTVLKTAS